MSGAWPSLAIHKLDILWAAGSCARPPPAEHLMSACMALQRVTHLLDSRMQLQAWMANSGCNPVSMCHREQTSG
jgi:hypothetical protein